MIIFSGLKKNSRATLRLLSKHGSLKKYLNNKNTNKAKNIFIM
jgi:hypothetical protein